VYIIQTKALLGIISSKNVQMPLATGSASTTSNWSLQNNAMLLHFMSQLTAAGLLSYCFHSLHMLQCINLQLPSSRILN